MNTDCKQCGQDLRLPPDALRVMRKYERALRDIRDEATVVSPRLREIAADSLKRESEGK